MTQHRYLLRTLAAIALAVALVGCSGGDDDGAEKAEEEPTTTTVVEFQGDGDSRYCGLSRRVILAPEEDSPEDLRKFYGGFDELAQQLLESSPSEIREDVAVFIDGVRSMREPLEAVDFDITRLDMDRVPALQDPAFPTAGNRVFAYNKQVCVGEGDGQGEPGGEEPGEGGGEPGQTGGEPADPGTGGPDEPVQSDDGSFD